MSDATIITENAYDLRLRIAELEAEVGRLQDADALNKTITSFNTQYYARIAELEAENARLTSEIADADRAIEEYRAAIRARPAP